MVQPQDGQAAREEYLVCSIEAPGGPFKINLCDCRRVRRVQECSCRCCRRFWVDSSTFRARVAERVLRHRGRSSRHGWRRVGRNWSICCPLGSLAGIEAPGWLFKWGILDCWKSFLTMFYSVVGGLLFGVDLSVLFGCADVPIVDGSFDGFDGREPHASGFAGRERAVFGPH